MIGNEKVKISKKHLQEIIDLVRKEHLVEEKEKKEEMETKSKQPPVTKNTWTHSLSLSLYLFFQSSQIRFLSST